MNDLVGYMKELNNKLLEASNAYYNTDSEIISNFEYDKLYDELVALEKETGISLSNSITNKVGYEPVSSLKKSEHKTPARSLAKTKSLDEIKGWIGSDDGCISWKLDGLTVVLTYKNGTLYSAVTRGNGIVGDDITEQARRFNNIPINIPNNDEIIVRGEAVISYSEFERINSNNEENKFKNPRNLVSGTVKSLDLEVLKERKVDFIAFTLVDSDNHFTNYFEQLDWLSDLGFDVVEHNVVDSNNVESYIDSFTENVKSGYNYPVDGLVIYINSLDRQEEMGENTHHPNYAMAFKWQDETQNTIIREIEWSKSRTGRINPVAIFDPVELEGTTVSRASLHNLTYIEDMNLNIGDEVSVYKANMIIPQIAEDFTNSLKDIEDIIPEYCPVCGCETKIASDNDSKFLVCDNKDCGGNADSITLFIGTLKIMHTSKKTVEKLIDAGLLRNRVDLFSLKDKREEFISIEGLGERAFDKLINEIDNINPTLGQFIAALGIDGVSTQNAKLLAKNFKDIHNLFQADVYDISRIEGFGDITANKVVDYIEDNIDEIYDLVELINIKPEEDIELNEDSLINGKVFAVTGSVNHFKNRKELQDVIEQNGGKVSGVSSKTDYLITNNPNSGSSKNKKAKELGVSIITEEEFLEMI